jgi:hypothetical protein
MPDQDPNEFTEREKFILSYYRDPQLSDPKRHLGYDLTIGLVSIGCVVVAITREEFAFGLVGYGILLWRLYQAALTNGRWTKDFQSIFQKYDAQFKALTETKRRDEKDVV